MPLYSRQSHDHIMLQCRKIQEVLNTYRNLMSEVKMCFGVDTSGSDEAWRIGTRAIGEIMAEVKGLRKETSNDATKVE